MSMLTVIFSILGFLITPFGLLAIILGLVTFLGLPVLASALNLEKPGQFYLGLARLPLKRAAVVIDEHNGAVFKQMTFDATGVEKVTLDGEPKEFEDPDGALHTWRGLPFALADEVSGVLFDPRHAALGMRKFDLVQRDEDTYEATTPEWEAFGIHKWKPAAFEMPNTYELVNLSRVRELIDGGERSEYPKRVKEIYKHSRAPFHDGNPISKFFYPILAFAITFGGIWFMSSQFGGGNIPGGSTVGYGTGILAFLITTPTRLHETNWRRIAGGLALIIPTLGLLGVITLFAGPLITLAAVLAYLLGFTMIPFFAIITQFSSVMAGVFSEFFFRLGFLSYQRPVFEWTPDGYHVRDYNTLDTTTDTNPTWYNLFGTQVGFTYTPGPESWGPEYIKRDNLEASKEAVTDGGTSGIDTNLPTKYVRADIERDIYGGFLPKRLSRDAYYLLSGIATARFNFSACGEKSLRRLLEAKETEGEPDGGMNDALVFKTTAASGLLGVILGVALFVL